MWCFKSWSHRCGIWINWRIGIYQASFVWTGVSSSAETWALLTWETSWSTKRGIVIWTVGSFKQSNTHKFTWFGNLPTPRSYWFVLIKLGNNTNNKTRRRRKILYSTQLSLALSLCVSLLFFSSYVSLLASLYINKILFFSQIWQPPFSMVRQPTVPNFAAMFDSSHAWHGCHHHHLVSTLNNLPLGHKWC